MRRRTWAYVLGGVVLLLLVIQLIPVSAVDDPPVEEEIAAPGDIMGILRRSCFDCHSNETVWPWYSRVMPAKWLVRRDVEEGREHLNFSTWNRYDAEERAEKLEEVAEEVEEEEMPLWFYTPLHRDARLTAEDRQRLVEWAALHAAAETR